MNKFLSTKSSISSNFRCSTFIENCALNSHLMIEFISICNATKIQTKMKSNSKILVQSIFLSTKKNAVFFQNMVLE